MRERLDPKLNPKKPKPLISKHTPKVLRVCERARLKKPTPYTRGIKVMYVKKKKSKPQTLNPEPTTHEPEIFAPESAE